MTGKIQLLSEETINQIAAGEVVENPSSVVKELIENAVDAKASQISIEILSGGFQLIRIDDDGIGMDREDLLLCLQRHTTSKIQKASDLNFLKTMGFRGEALASIASISKMLLISAKKDQIANQVAIEGGKILYTSQAARNLGTTIEVRSLFYNVPARKQFQKTPASSTAEITKVVTAQALAHPEIDFDYIVQNQTIFSLKSDPQKTKAANLLQRSKDLLGGHFLKEVLPVDETQDLYLFQGILGIPSSHSHNRGAQHLFINERPVISPLISYAIKDAYGTRLPPDRYPVFVLHIQIPPHLIDVNVHPQKKEIRFTDEKLIRLKIQKMVQAALHQTTLKNPLWTEAQTSVDFCNTPSNLSSDFQSQPPAFYPTWSPTSFPSTFQEKLPESSFRESLAPASNTPSLIPQGPQIIGIFSNYLIVDAKSLPHLEKEGIVFIDLLAASEKITFENLVKEKSPLVEKQGLLIPEIFHPSHEELLVLEGYAKEIQQIGFDIRCCGKNQWMIDAIPSFIDPQKAVEIFKELLLELPLERLEKGDSKEKLIRLSQAASRFARRRKKNFMLQEAQEILKQLIQTSAPFFCPRGGSTLIYMSCDEIEKKFSKKS